VSGHKWERLPDRTTETGEVIETEVAEIEGQTWYHGTIPSQSTPDPRPGWFKRLIRRKAKR
jgi:hypothetical protein